MCVCVCVWCGVFVCVLIIFSSCLYSLGEEDLFSETDEISDLVDQLIEKKYVCMLSSERESGWSELSDGGFCGCQPVRVCEWRF